MIPLPPAYQDGLIDLIYAATLGELPWQRFVDEIATGLPGGRSTMFHHDPARGCGHYLLTANMDPGDVRAYNETWAALNPWMPAAARRPVGLGVVAEQMLDPSILKRSALYNGYLKPMGVHTATGITIERSDGRLFLLSVLTSRDDPAANRGHANTLTAIAPHLRRAFRHMRHQGDSSRIGEAALDALGVGVVVVGHDAACRRVSRLAQSLMDATHALRIDGRSHLRPSDPALCAALRDMLWRDPPEQRVRQTLVIENGHALRVTLIRIVADALSDCLQGPTVVVLLDPLTGAHDGTRPDLRALDGVARRHRLTRAETEVLQAVASGLTAAQIAQMRGVTAETVRCQIKMLFAKTGARRQAELVRLVLSAGPRDG